MKDVLEDNHGDYCSIPHEEWCDLLSTMEVKDNKKRAADQIKRLATSKAAPINSKRDGYTRVPRKKKARAGVLPIRKQHGKRTSKHHGAQR